MDLCTKYGYQKLLLIPINLDIKKIKKYVKRKNITIHTNTIYRNILKFILPWNAASRGNGLGWIVGRKSTEQQSKVKILVEHWCVPPLNKESIKELANWKIKAPPTKCFCCEFLWNVLLFIVLFKFLMLLFVSSSFIHLEYKTIFNHTLFIE